MSLPRQILPGSTYLITRSCSQRQFLLRPCEMVVQVFLYCLCYAMRPLGVEIHAVVVLSDHYHLVVTDPLGLLPRLMEVHNKLVAKCLNIFWGRGEHFWSPGSYRCQRCFTAEDILRAMVYVKTNPVKHGLVRRASAWPGLVSTPEHLDGRHLEVARPSVFFRGEGKMPRRLSLRLSAPPGFGHLSQEDFIDLLRARVTQREDELASELSGRFLGARRVLRSRHTDTAVSRLPRRNLNPKIKAKNAQIRIGAIQALQTFLRSYREAYRSWRDGDHAVVFPAGTWWMGQHTSARVMKPPPVTVMI